MKKTICAALLLCLLCGCAAQDAEKPEETPAEPPVAETPAHPEKPTPEETRQRWQAARDAWETDHPASDNVLASEDELRAEYGAAIDAWAQSQTLLTLDRATLDGCEVDSLLMDAAFNQRDRCNVSLEVSVYYDAAKVGDGSAVAAVTILDQVPERISAALADTASGGRVRTLLVSFRAPDGTLRYTKGERGEDAPRVVDASFRIPAPESAEERHAQTIAFDYAAAINAECFNDPTLHFPFGEVWLKHFGVSPEDGGLYIELAMTFAAGKDAAEQAAFTDGLEGRAQTLFDAIMADAPSAAFLAAQGVSSVTVAFHTPWEKQGAYFHTYAYPVAE